MYKDVYECVYQYMFTRQSGLTLVFKLYTTVEKEVDTMIFGHILNFEQDKAMLSPILQVGLRYLKNTDLAKLPIGRHDIDGDNIFVSVSEYELEPKENRRPEAHRKYIDIQYVAWGEEVIGHSLLSSKYEIIQDELAERDVIFYKEVEHEAQLVLKPGIYAIFFPTDVHRPGCMSKNKGQVKKIVVKISLSSL